MLTIIPHDALEGKDLNVIGEKIKKVLDKETLKKSVETSLNVKNKYKPDDDE